LIQFIPRHGCLLVSTAGRVHSSLKNSVQLLPFYLLRLEFADASSFKKNFKNFNTLVHIALSPLGDKKSFFKSFGWHFSLDAVNREMPLWAGYGDYFRRALGECATGIPTWLT